MIKAVKIKNEIEMSEFDRVDGVVDYISKGNEWKRGWDIALWDTVHIKSTQVTEKNKKI